VALNLYSPYISSWHGQGHLFLQCGMLKIKKFFKALKFLASIREAVSSNLAGDTEYTDINFVNFLNLFRQIPG
jgi:hypothetical protein